MASRTYGIVWRWHFLAGLVACPVILVLALTGGAYVFQPELERMLYSDLREVTPRGPAMTLDELMAKVPEDCRTGSIGVPREPTMAMQVWCSEAAGSVFIDPYTGKVLGREVWGETLFGIVFALHWELLLGETGRLVVEWATSFTIVMLLSGAYLWWPSRRGGGKWWPRRRVASRQRLRDLHSVAGIYLLPVTFIIAATGLFWTRFAGEDRWHRVATDPFEDVWKSPPKSSPAAGRPRIGYDRAVAAANLDGPRETSLDIGKEPDAPYSIWSTRDGNGTPSSTQSVYIDAYDGTVLRRIGWEGRSVLNKLGQAGYALHVGTIAGLPGRIAALIAALVLAALCITGPWMWWQRRPAGSLGVPPRAQRVAWPFVIGLGALGWLMPTVGYTLIAVVLYELAAAGVRRLRGPGAPTAAISPTE
jgi:uncharacterized iron-regulated membrane protein